MVLPPLLSVHRLDHQHWACCHHIGERPDERLDGAVGVLAFCDAVVVEGDEEHETVVRNSELGAKGSRRHGLDDGDRHAANRLVGDGGERLSNEGGARPDLVDVCDRIHHVGRDVLELPEPVRNGAAAMEKRVTVVGDEEVELVGVHDDEARVVVCGQLRLRRLPRARAPRAVVVDGSQRDVGCFQTGHDAPSDVSEARIEAEVADHVDAVPVVALRHDVRSTDAAPRTDETGPGFELPAGADPRRECRLVDAVGSGERRLEVGPPFAEATPVLPDVGTPWWQGGLQPFEERRLVRSVRRWRKFAFTATPGADRIGHEQADRFVDSDGSGQHQRHRLARRLPPRSIDRRRELGLVRQAGAARFAAEVDVPRCGATDRLDVDEKRRSVARPPLPPGHDHRASGHLRAPGKAVRALQPMTDLVVGLAVDQLVGQPPQRRQSIEPEARHGRAEPSLSDHVVFGGRQAVGRQLLVDARREHHRRGRHERRQRPQDTHRPHSEDDHSIGLVRLEQRCHRSSGARPFVGTPRHAHHQATPTDAGRFGQAEVGPRRSGCGTWSPMRVTAPDGTDVPRRMERTHRIDDRCEIPGTARNHQAHDDPVSALWFHQRRPFSTQSSRLGARLGL